MGVRRADGGTELCPELVFLIHEVEPGALIDVPVQYIAGICVVVCLSRRIICHMPAAYINQIRGVAAAVVSIFYGSAPVPAVGIVCFNIEIMSERLGVHNPSCHGSAFGILVISLVDNVIDCSIVLECPRQGLVESPEVIVAEIVAEHH